MCAFILLAENIQSGSLNKRKSESSRMSYLLILFFSRRDLISRPVCRSRDEAQRQVISPGKRRVHFYILSTRGGGCFPATFWLSDVNLQPVDPLAHR